MFNYVPLRMWAYLGILKGPQGHQGSTYEKPRAFGGRLHPKARRLRGHEMTLMESEEQSDLSPGLHLFPGIHV